MRNSTPRASHEETRNLDGVAFSWESTSFRAQRILRCVFHLSSRGMLKRNTYNSIESTAARGRKRRGGGGGGGVRASTNAERVHFTGHGISEISRYRLSLSIDVPSPPSPFLPLASPPSSTTTTSLSASRNEGGIFARSRAGQRGATQPRNDGRTDGRFSHDTGNSSNPFLE